MSSGADRRNGQQPAGGGPAEWAERAQNLDAAAAKQRLEQGNQRYSDGTMTYPNSDEKRRHELVGGQRPFATVITCADSRVPPELIFDQGLGDLFVIRVAGNISDDAVLASAEYAALHLGVNLIVVMGHRACGAVSAAVDNVDVDGPATHSHIDALIEAIRPAVRRAESKRPNDLLETSVRENAILVAEQVRQADPIIARLGQHGVAVQPAYYDLQSGKVDWLAP